MVIIARETGGSSINSKTSSRGSAGAAAIVAVLATAVTVASSSRVSVLVAPKR
jgi:hypothetical protein